MTSLRRWLLGTSLLGLCLTFAGCQTLDFLSPSNTWRLNRGPALDEDVYFSISDPIE